MTTATRPAPVYRYAPHPAEVQAFLKYDFGWGGLLDLTHELNEASPARREALLDIAEYALKHSLIEIASNHNRNVFVRLTWGGVHFAEHGSLPAND